MQGIGTDFQELTSYTRQNVGERSLDWSQKPPTFKRYEAPRVPLTTPEIEGGMPVWKAMQRRRSHRDFVETPISSEMLSQLVWAT